MITKKNVGSRICLGTVQFGLDYGVSNSKGKLPIEESKETLRIADSSGILVYDTAPAYGNSEAVLGELLSSSPEIKIVTKTVKVEASNISLIDLQFVDDNFKESLRSLKKSTVYALLVHHADDLLKPGGKAYYDLLCDWKAKGIVEKIGLSIYSWEQYLNISGDMPVDIVQLPLNVLDQKWVKRGYLKLMKSHGVEIHARSVFLQGLLLMDEASLHDYFRPIKKNLENWWGNLHESNITKLQGALQYVLGIDDVDYLVVGVSSPNELVEIIEAATNQVDLPLYDELDLSDTEYVNPSLWRIE